MNYLINPNNCEIEGSGIYLEPRLQEYITKKETYKKYNIKPVVSLEVEFGITTEDKKKIKMIKKNGGQLFEDANNPIYHENISNVSLNSNNLLDSQFSSKGFLTDNIKDKKFEKMFQKYDKIKQKDESRREQILKNQNNQNMSGWLGENDKDIVDSRFFSADFTSSRYNDDKFNEETKVENKKYINKPAITTERTFNKNNDDFYNPYSLSQKNQTHKTAKIAYNQKLHNDDNIVESQKNVNDIDNIIGNYESYRKQVNPKFQKTMDFDFEHKRTIPSVSSNGKKNLNTSSYKTMPFMGYDTDAKNINEENQLLQGMPVRTHKSYGYNNSFENQFQYISNDIQSPDHTVMSFPRGGYGTRQYNRENYKDNKYKREIYK
jgi:hypothetical protein